MKGLVKFFLLFLPIIILITFISTPVLAEGIKVGVIIPLTGKLAKFGDIESNSFQMAVDEINEMGGINGKKIELIIEDTKGIPEIGRSATEKLISQDKVVIIGGGYSSTVTWASIAVAQQHKVPFLVNTASADRITEQGWEYIFRLNPPVSEHSWAFKSFVKQVAMIKTAAILHENSLFGQFWTKKFIKQCWDLGIKVVMNEGYETEAIDFKPLLLKVKSKEPDLIYMISDMVDASLLMKQSKELDLNPKLFLGHDAGFTHPELHHNAGDASEYVCSATIWSPSVPYPRVREYYENFVTKYDLFPDYHGAQSYGAIYVIADALKRAKSLTPEDVKDALANTNIMTVFGPVKFISYGKKTQQNRLPTYLVQWLDGKLETIWPSNVATARYVYPAPEWSER